MSYDPFAYGNPGRGPGGQHPWETQPPPRPYDGALPPDGRVNPDNSPSYVQYQNELIGARIADEQRRIAETTPRYYPASTSVTTPPRVVQSSKPKVGQATTQKAALPRPVKKSKPQLPPGKYLVIDKRKPNLGSGYTQLIMPILGCICALTMMNMFFANLFSDAATLIVLVASLLVSIMSFGIVLYRAETRDFDHYKMPDIWNPILLSLPALPIFTFLLYGIDLNVTRVVLLSLLGFLAMFLYASANDSKEITQSIAKRKWGNNIFEASLVGQTCNLCNGFGEPAVALRRYFFNSKNIRLNYTPVCEKHQHYVRVVHSDGRVEWPQNEDCTQPGMLKMTIKK